MAQLIRSLEELLSKGLDEIGIPREEKLPTPGNWIRHGENGRLEILISRYATLLKERRPTKRALDAPLWVCKNCEFENFEHLQKCSNCETVRQ